MLKACRFPELRLESLSRDSKCNVKATRSHI
jgi:hypothetical protein